ncbi:MAG: PepSY-associated TM helix domain-containing protein [Gallionella sp.]
MTRHFWVLFHRYAGLFMAFFLIVIGLTGSIIVFNPELNRWFDPPPKVMPQDTLMLDAYTLRERAQALVPHGVFNNLTFHVKPDEPYSAWVEPRIDLATDKPYELGVTMLMLDPFTGAELKRENYTGDIWPITQKNIMTLINRLHYQMALPGSVGSYLFGIVALVWTLDCFVSGYLTFPVSIRRRKSAPSPSIPLPAGEGSVLPSPAGGRAGDEGRSFLSRWWNPAWLVKWNGSAHRINFDLHRAGGLWVWIMLLALAWSSVGFNLAEEVYNPVMKAVFNMPDPYGADLPKLEKPQPEPALSWMEAHSIAQRLMAEQARKNRFTVQYEDSLVYQADKGSFIYSVRSDRDLMDEGASTTMVFDGSGKFASLSVPTGQNAGSTINSWIFALHMAQIWGLPFRIFVTCVGILIAMLSVTGVYIWLKKRNARHASREKHARLLEEETSI